MRLDRYLTLCDLGTRREVKELIASGRVSVAGLTVLNPGSAVDGPVTLDGESVGYRPLVAIMMNKPTGLLTATTDRRQGTVPVSYTHLGNIRAQRCPDRQNIALTDSR